MFGLWAEYARLGQCCEATVGRPTQADFSCKTPFLEIARRLDAASLPSRCSNCVARRRPWQPRRRWPWGAVRQGPSARVGSGSSGVGGGFSYFFLCDQATCKRRRREGDIRGPSSLSLHELPNMATHREKLRAVHTADDITDNGCQYARRR